MTAPRSARAELARVAQALHARGWVANHDGNVSLRQDGGRFLATPTATSKADVTERTLIEVDAGGKVVGGPGKPFGELGLHLAVYERRPDVHAVVHAHPPHATALAVAGSPALEQPFLAEAVVSLGPRVPTVPAAPPGAPARDALLRFVTEFDAVLIGNHGAMAWGRTLEQAYLRLELVEHLARVAILAAPLGGVRPLPDEVIGPLLAARARAGLGAAADQAEKLGLGRPVVGCAPAPHAAVDVIPPGGRPSGVDPASVAAMIREEIERALR